MTIILSTRTYSPISILQNRITRLALLLIFTSLLTIYLLINLNILSSTSHDYYRWYHLASKPGIRYLDGVAYVDKITQGGRHPIEELIQRGKEKAEELERKKSGVKSLRDAVEDYRLNFRKEPPEGFETWYKLAQKLHVPPVPSLYPLAVESILPFLSLPAPLLRQRARELVAQRGIFGLEYRPESELNKTTPIGLDNITIFRSLRAEWTELTKDDIGLLPPNQILEEPMMLAIWVDDVSHHPPSGNLLSRSRDLAMAGKVWDEDELVMLEAQEGVKQGWGNACESPIDQQIGKEAISVIEKTTSLQSSFIDDPMLYADPCRHPEHLRQNGEMIMKEEWTLKGLLPLTSLNSPIGGGEIIGPTTIGRKVVMPYMPWKDKVESRLWWRGNANSAFIYDQWDWRSSQRFRLSEFASGRKEKPHIGSSAGLRDDDGVTASPVLLELGNNDARREWRERDQLRKTYLDISLIDAVITWPCGGHYAPFFYCEPNGSPKRPNCPMKLDNCYDLLYEEYEFAKKDKNKTYEYQHKFRLDVDGFGWTTRFREELSKNNVVIKVTLYPEWWTPQAIPWYHYIPGRYDFSDLYDIMAFFTGTPEELKGAITDDRKEVLKARDKMAEDIAARGREFALNTMTWEGMRVYMFLLLLEYRRAWSDDRIAATFDSSHLA